jgi:choline dehydrogenase-like flavoprotein
VRCGFCGYGCQLGAKQSTLKTYLQDAFDQGARMIVNAHVERILIEYGRATGVLASVLTARGDRVELRVRARVVAAACGSIETPALLLRSGLRAPAIGKHLKLHPATAVSGVFDETIRPWEGTMQAIFSDQFVDLDGRNFGLKIESAPLHPALLAMVTPWRRPEHYNRLMRALPSTTVPGVLLRDRDGGRVVVRDGATQVHYRLSKYDQAHLRRGIEAAVRILEAAGAIEIFTSQGAYVSYRPGQPGGIDAYMAEVDRYGYGATQMSYISFHQMGSCRMGLDPATSVVDARQEAHSLRGLFIADASVFPSASGVNPMLTIMALAHRASRYIAAAC